MKGMMRIMVIMRTKTSKRHRSKRSGNTKKLNIFEQDMKMRIRIMRSMKTKRSKSKRSRRSGNTYKIAISEQETKRIMR